MSATPWTVALQVPLSMGYFRQEYWSGLPFPPPGDLPNPGIEPVSPAPPALPADSLSLSPWGDFNQYKKEEYSLGSHHLLITQIQ